MTDALCPDDRYVSVDEDREIRDKYLATYKQERLCPMLPA
jgi:hypothetical protein